MKDIAKTVGVSQPTVSAVLRDKEYCYVSQQKKDLIKKAAKEMGYVPNQSALNLKGMPSKTIGIIGSLFGVPIHSQFINHLTNKIWDMGYHVMLADSRAEIKREKEIINDFLARGVDAFIISGTKYIRENFYENIKYLHLKPGCKESDALIDIEDGEYQAVNHLIKAHKHENIMFFTSNIESNSAKFDGYKKALKENGIRFSENLVLESGKEKNTAKKLIEYFMKKKFTAIVASNDELALRIINLFEQNNIKVPQDLAVIGFDDLPICEYSRPSLTSVMQPVEEHADKTLKLLIGLLKGKEKSEIKKAVSQTKLVCRKSCGCKNSNKSDDNFFEPRTK
jgi:LacI family transcriptional regulator